MCALGADEDVRAYHAEQRAQQERQAQQVAKERHDREAQIAAKRAAHSREERLRQEQEAEMQRRAEEDARVRRRVERDVRVGCVLLTWFAVDDDALSRPRRSASGVSVTRRLS